MCGNDDETGVYECEWDWSEAEPMRTTRTLTVSSRAIVSLDTGTRKISFTGYQWGHRHAVYEV